MPTKLEIGVSNDGFISDDAVLDRKIRNEQGLEYKDVELGDGTHSENLEETQSKKDDSENITEKRSIKCYLTSCKAWLTGTNFFVYASHFLSAWGDRMWAFGVGLFLIEIASESLQLTAIYGLASACSYLLFGAIVGDWVDRTPRLRAAQISLGLQNLFVIICAAVVYLHLWFLDYIQNQWDGWMLRLSYAIIIILAILASMASLARTIAVEKDWIVEICGRDKDHLAQMTSGLRRIDLGTKILAPIATGQIMTYVGLEFGAVFIGGWNLVTVFIEYYLIWKVYQTVPALKKKKDVSKHDDREEKLEEVELKDATDLQTPKDDVKDVERESPKDKSITVEHAAETVQSDLSEKHDKTEESPQEKNVEEKGEKEGKSDVSPISKSTEPTQKKTEEKEEVTCKFGKGFITLYKGWRTYLRYNVCNAGIGLACLYMTVLGFDNITVGYAYSQNISESILGFLMAAGAIVGILGTIVYPIIRRRIGLERTGLFALTCQILCLVTCVVSVFMPGSPFNIFHRSTKQIETNCSLTTEPKTIGYNYSEPTESSVLIVQENMLNFTQNTTNPCTEESSYSYVSIAMLMTGIITARFGLWTADLTITQLFLENVEEKERGIVNGVQQSLNRLMDLLKFAMVVAAPEPQLFGVLVFISFAFVCLGAVFYASYSRKTRGHLFHFEKIVKCSNNNNQQYAVSQAV